MIGWEIVMTKDKLLDIASDEFAKYGYDGVSMSKLALLVGINKATIYHHFKSKKSLYEEVLIRMIDEHKERTNKILVLDVSPIEKLNMFIQMTVKELVNDANMVALTLREFANFGSNIDDEFVPNIESSSEALKSILKELNIKEKFRDIDVFTVESIIIGTTSIYFSMQHSSLNVKGLKAFKDSDELIEHLSDVISESISSIIERREDDKSSSNRGAISHFQWLSE